MAKLNYTHVVEFANSVDPDEMADNSGSTLFAF